MLTCMTELFAIFTFSHHVNQRHIVESFSFEINDERNEIIFIHNRDEYHLHAIRVNIV